MGHVEHFVHYEDEQSIWHNMAKVQYKEVGSSGHVTSSARQSLDVGRTVSGGHVTYAR